ncbi:MAG: VOC family protein, partial [bacterium]
LYVADLERSRAFYHGLQGLNCTVLPKGAMHFFGMPDGGMLLCFIGEVTRRGGDLPPHGATGPQHLAFEATLEH